MIKHVKPWPLLTIQARLKFTWVSLSYTQIHLITATTPYSSCYLKVDLVHLKGTRTLSMYRKCPALLFHLESTTDPGQRINFILVSDESWDFMLTALWHSSKVKREWEAHVELWGLGASCILWLMAYCKCSPSLSPLASLLNTFLVTLWLPEVACDAAGRGTHTTCCCSLGSACLFTSEGVQVRHRASSDAAGQHGQSYISGWLNTQFSFELLVVRQQREKMLLNHSCKHYTVRRHSKNLECHPLI